MIIRHHIGPPRKPGQGAERDVELEAQRDTGTDYIAQIMPATEKWLAFFPDPGAEPWYYTLPVVAWGLVVTYDFMGRCVSEDTSVKALVYDQMEYGGGLVVAGGRSDVFHDLVGLVRGDDADAVDELKGLAIIRARMARGTA